MTAETNTTARSTEKIAGAALHKKTQLGYLTFSMPPPARHSDIISAMNGLPIDVHECEQGFVTNCGRFVSRAMARSIAERQEQLNPDARNHTELFSEDVW